MHRNILRLSAVTLAILLVGTHVPLQAAAESADYDGEVVVEPVDLLTTEELRDLVAPIALYPDDLIAIILPASTYPLQIVAAARHRELAASTDNIEPDESWDESVVALMNYPEALAMLDEDLDWTWSLGQAVTDQQSDVLNAITDFRQIAADAGNLQTDERQEVVHEDERIIVRSRDREVVYVPYYDPYDVTVRQTTRVYHYYPDPYPVYYYPYSYGHRFYDSHLFWGVSSVFFLSWSDYHLYHYGHSHYRHPFYRHTYQRRHFRRTHHYHTPAARKHRHARHERYYNERHRRGDRAAPWRPNHRFAGVHPGRRADRHERRDRSHRAKQRRPRNEHHEHLAQRKQRNLHKSLRSPDLRQPRRERETPRSSVHRSVDREVRPQSKRSVVHRETRRATPAQPRREHFKPRPQQREQRAQPKRDHFKPKRNERRQAAQQQAHQGSFGRKALNQRQQERKQQKIARQSAPRREKKQAKASAYRGQARQERSMKRSNRDRGSVHRNARHQSIR